MMAQTRVAAVKMEKIYILNCVNRICWWTGHGLCRNRGAKGDSTVFGSSNWKHGVI